MGFYGVLSPVIEWVMAVQKMGQGYGDNGQPPPVDRASAGKRLRRWLVAHPFLSLSLDFFGTSLLFRSLSLPLPRRWFYGELSRVRLRTAMPSCVHPVLASFCFDGPPVWGSVRYRCLVGGCRGVPKGCSSARPFIGRRPRILCGAAVRRWWPYSSELLYLTRSLHYGS